MKKAILLSLLTVFISSCSIDGVKKEHTRKLDINDETLKTSAFKSPFSNSDMYIKVDQPYSLKSNPLLDKTISVAIKEPVNIVVAIDFADKGLSVSIDKGVDLDKKVIINFKNQTLRDYFKYLENITGYHLTLENRVVFVKAQQFKTWNLQSLSMINQEIQSSSVADIDSSENGTIATKSSNENWESIVEHVKTIMGSDSEQNQSNPSGGNSSLKSPVVVVTDNQQLGTISALGLPIKIRQVDEWINGLIASSNRQVHMQVQVLDVTVDESIGRGIDWNLISKQSSQLQIGAQAEQKADGAGLLLFGTPAGAAIDLGKKISLELMLNLLSKQGKVRVDNQPNITVSNGREAYITTGDEFSFISSVDAAQDANGNVITTSEVERMTVGVDMKVTAKILPDDRIVLSIVPIVSSLKSYTTLVSGSGASTQEFQTPNIALQKLTTQVIVESGKTIHLGGLIASKVTEAAKGLPGGGIFDALFQGEQQSLERREIVILITPTIVR